MNKAASVIFILVWIVATLALLAWAAGTWSLPFFWAVFGTQLLFGFVGLGLLDSDLISERMRPRGVDQDSLGRLLITILYLSHLFVAALDAGRWHITDSIPLSIRVIALVVHALGCAGLLWCMRVNRFFSSAVRVQTDRGQFVVMTGPYQWVRHPGYVFATLLFFGEGLAFGSWLCLVPIVLIVLQFIYRTILEELLLQNELPGYREYSERVRYRWLPGIW